MDASTATATWSAFIACASASRARRGSIPATFSSGPVERGTKTSKRGTSSAPTTSAATCWVVRFLTPRASVMPLESSVLTIPGMTHEISTPEPLSSNRTASESPTTACLVAA